MYYKNTRCIELNRRRVTAVSERCDKVKDRRHEDKARQQSVGLMRQCDPTESVWCQKTVRSVLQQRQKKYTEVDVRPSATALHKILECKMYIRQNPLQSFHIRGYQWALSREKKKRTVSVVWSTTSDSWQCIWDKRQCVLRRQGRSMSDHRINRCSVSYIYVMPS